MFNVNGDPDLCNFMARSIYPYACRLAGSGGNNFLVSVDAEVLWTNFTKEITETTVDLIDWLLMSPMNPDYEYQEHHHHLQDQEDGGAERERRYIPSYIV